MRVQRRRLSQHTSSTSIGLNSHDRPEFLCGTCLDNKRKSRSSGAIPKLDGCGQCLAADTSLDRAVLCSGEGWTKMTPSRAREDAAHLLRPAMFGLTDPGAERPTCESEWIRQFVGVEHTVPDEFSILRFRHLLEEHLTRGIFDEVGALLKEKGLLLKKLRSSTPTILAVPSSTKETHRDTRPGDAVHAKGNTWHFGRKVQVGTDTRGIVHSLTTTDAAQFDISASGSDSWRRGAIIRPARSGVRTTVPRSGIRRGVQGESARHCKASFIRGNGGRSTGSAPAYVPCASSVEPGETVVGIPKVRYRGSRKTR